MLCYDWGIPRNIWTEFSSPEHFASPNIDLGRNCGPSSSPACLDCSICAARSHRTSATKPIFGRTISWGPPCYILNKELIRDQSRDTKPCPASDSVVDLIPAVAAQIPHVVRRAGSGEQTTSTETPPHHYRTPGTSGWREFLRPRRSHCDTRYATTPEPLRSAST